MKKNDTEVKRETRELKAVTEEVESVIEKSKAEVDEEILQTPFVPEPDPAIEEISEDKVQLREAHWITERSGFQQKSHCSHCGAAAMAARGSNDETLTTFCPMCGFIML